jgi:hypothetical protein
MITTTISAQPGIDAALVAGLRWLYATNQPEDALVERAGARVKTAERLLRFLPLTNTGTPLIVVDLLHVNWGISSYSPPLNSLPPDELPSLAAELAALGIHAGAQHYHGITGTIVLDAPAHPSLIAAVHRYDQGCPRHRTQLCEAPVRDGGQGCSWHADGHRRAIWPTSNTPAGDIDDTQDQP